MNEINMVDVCRNMEKPTVDDAIRWYQEEAWRNGVLGFGRDVGDLKDIFHDWNAECPPVSYFQATPGNPLDLSNVPQKLAASAALAEARHQEKMRIIDEDFFLKEDVKIAVHRRLLGAGIHPHEIDLNTQKMESMTMMTAYLWDIEHRTPNFDFNMKALVFTNFRGTKLPTLTVLPTKAPFPELLASLKEFVIGKAEMTGRRIAAGEDIEFLDAWLYKMTDCKNGKPIFIDKHWHRLSYDHHYQTMLKRFSGQGQGSMIPLFVPVNRPPIEALAGRGVLNGTQLQAQQGPSSVAANSAEISRTDTVGQEESLARVDWADLTQKYYEGLDFQLLFGDG